MRVLLDTHALLWWFSDDPALTRAARKIIADTKNTLVVSAASAWSSTLSAPDSFRGRTGIRLTGCSSLKPRLTIFPSSVKKLSSTPTGFGAFGRPPS